MLNFIMSNAFGREGLVASSSITELLASPVAIIIYLFIVLVAIAVIVIAVIVKEKGSTGAVEYKISYDGDSAPSSEKEDVPEETGERFYMLSTIDGNERRYMRSSYDKGITLKELCDNFRNYAASNHGLYYDIEDIRRFIAGMSVSHILILQGMS